MTYTVVVVHPLSTTLPPFLITWIESNFLAYKYDFVYIHFYFLLRFSVSTWFSDGTRTYIYIYKITYTPRCTRRRMLAKKNHPSQRIRTYTHHAVYTRWLLHSGTRIGGLSLLYIIYDIIIYIICISGHRNDNNITMFLGPIYIYTLYWPLNILSILVHYPRVKWNM